MGPAAKIFDHVAQLADWNQGSFSDGQYPQWNAGTGKFVGANVSLSGLTTDNLPEGSTNKYFTNARVLAALPTVAGQGGKFLSTDGTSLLFATAVTSVGLTLPGSLFSPTSPSPVTTSGTVTVALATQVANNVFAGPTGGGAAVPSFRVLAVSDIPALPQSQITGLVAALAVAALDSAVVHKAGTETISGAKTFSALTTVGTLAVNDGTLTYLAVDSTGRPSSSNTQPTFVAGPAAGTGPTISIVGTDTSGVIAVTAGTTPATSDVIVTLNYSTVRGVLPRAVIVTPSNVTTQALFTGGGGAFCEGSTTTGFNLEIGSTALSAAGNYKWSYLVL